MAENIARLRVTDGKTIEDVARGTGLPVALITAVEGGRRQPPPKSLRSLASYFGVSVDTLLR
ncbi:helix-turn-helix domain-containing protein [Aureimonas phyllosphaerae]|uniref:helix-turn-helix domain-containing protein n=1 Tax=Aureimonas phyllosphaerae TaxID=1166078 RepID=UPI003A5C1241